MPLKDDMARRVCVSFMFTIDVRVLISVCHTRKMVARRLIIIARSFDHSIGVLPSLFRDSSRHNNLQRLEAEAMSR